MQSSKFWNILELWEIRIFVEVQHFHRPNWVISVALILGTVRSPGQRQSGAVQGEAATETDEADRCSDLGAGRDVEIKKFQLFPCDFQTFWFYLILILWIYINLSKIIYN